MTLPAILGRLADPAAAWAHLAEAAEFFAVPMPDLDELRAACARFLRGAQGLPLVVVHVTVVDVDDAVDSAAHVLVAGGPVARRTDAVRIDVSDATSPLVRPDDPHWRRMAARTTSRAAEDRLHRQFEDRGCVDCVGADAVPFLGALVFETPAAVYGLENPEPTSVLEQLRDCGAVRGVQMIDRVPVDAERVWWISPRFETRPVSAVGATAYRLDSAVPSFARCA